MITETEPETFVAPNGEEIPLKTCEVVSYNMLTVKAGTNGYHGGDTGHGSKTYFSISDLGGTRMEVKSRLNRFSVYLEGDSELRTFIEALRFIANSLEEKAGKYEH